MSDRMYVATRKGLFRLDRSPTGWHITEASFLGDNCSIVMHDPRDGALYAGLDHGHFGCKMQRSDDEGASWEETATPAYPPQPERLVEAVPMEGEPAPWDLKLLWALEPGGPDEPGTLWCGTIPGGLFRSDDRGASWALNRALWDRPERLRWFGGGYPHPGIHSICVDPRDARHVSVGVSCGGTWVTRDGGKTWACKATGMRAEYMPPEQQHDPLIQDPHLLVQCRDDPDRMWVQHHNGIFRSTDGSESWSEIAEAGPSTFGFAVAVHPHDGQTAWFVPALQDQKRIPVDGQVVVTRTRDGGASFDVLTRGLPQEHAYDLTFRHALDIDDTGDCLAFGTTTGSLFVSENQGDDWSAVSTHLPPVYAVQFVKE